MGFLRSLWVYTCYAIFAFTQNSTEPVIWFISDICIAVICCIPPSAPSPLMHPVWCLGWHASHMGAGGKSGANCLLTIQGDLNNIGDWQVENFVLSSIVDGKKWWCFIGSRAQIDTFKDVIAVMWDVCNVSAHPDASFPPCASLLGPIL